LLSRLVARDEAGRFLCPLCRQAYPTIKAVSVHQKHFHEDSGLPDNDADACMLDLLARKAGPVDTAVKSDDGPIRKKDVKVCSKFPCRDCSQVYDTEKALSMHHKWIHGEDGKGGPANVGYTLVYEFNGFKSTSSDHAQTQVKSPIVLPQVTDTRKPSRRRVDTHDPRDPFWQEVKAPPAASKL